LKPAMGGNSRYKMHRILSSGSGDRAPDARSLADPRAIAPPARLRSYRMSRHDARRSRDELPGRPAGRICSGARSPKLSDISATPRASAWPPSRQRAAVLGYAALSTPGAWFPRQAPVAWSAKQLTAGAWTGSLVDDALVVLRGRPGRQRLISLETDPAQRPVPRHRNGRHRRSGRGGLRLLWAQRR